MESLAHSPVLSGMIGGALALLIGHALRRWMPDPGPLRSANSLVHAHRGSLRVANGLFFSGLLVGLGLYHYEIFDRSDLVGLGLSFGGALTAPLIPLVLWPRLLGRNAGEIWMAWCFQQRMPSGLMIVILALGVGLLAASIVALLMR